MAHKQVSAADKPSRCAASHL